MKRFTHVCVCVGGCIEYRKQARSQAAHMTPVGEHTKRRLLLTLPLIAHEAREHDEGGNNGWNSSERQHVSGASLTQ